jgi:hypothetical protein
VREKLPNFIMPFTNLQHLTLLNAPIKVEGFFTMLLTKRPLKTLKLKSCSLGSINDFFQAISLPDDAYEYGKLRLATLEIEMCTFDGNLYDLLTQALQTNKSLVSILTRKSELTMPQLANLFAAISQHPRLQTLNLQNVKLNIANPFNLSQLKQAILSLHEVPTCRLHTLIIDNQQLTT